MTNDIDGRAMRNAGKDGCRRNDIGITEELNRPEIIELQVAHVENDGFIEPG